MREWKSWCLHNSFSFLSLLPPCHFLPFLFIPEHHTRCWPLSLTLVLPCYVCSPCSRFFGWPVQSAMMPLSEKHPCPASLPASTQPLPVWVHQPLPHACQHSLPLLTVLCASASPALVQRDLEILSPPSPGQDL
jgi:hypothetical protein